VGGVLFQTDDEGGEHPIAYLSAKFNKDQRNCSITELECYAAILSIRWDVELPLPSAKRSKIQPSVSFAEITKDQVLLGLTDNGNPEGRITRNKWKA